MEGDWIAAVDWDAPGDGGGSQATLARLVSLVEPAGVASDAARIVSGDRGAILAGHLELAGGTRGSARDLLDGYRERGRSFFERLRGRFAAVIWDGSRRELIAFRDPMGMYPLFVSSRRRQMLISPSIERLCEAGGEKASVDRVALAEHLWHRWPDKRRTYFEGVRRIPAGHLLRATEDDEVLHRYWDPGSGADQDVDWLEPSELEQFEEMLDRAIRRCTGGRRTGIFLSGGLDSVSIASRLAPGLSPGDRPPADPPFALSLGFRHPACDESEIQAAVAGELGLRHELREVPAGPGRAGPLERAGRLAAGWPVPLMNVWNGEFYRLAELASRRGCAVILTGSGGDDWLGVTPYLAADLLGSGRLRTLARLVGTVRASHGLSLSEAARLVLWSFGARALARQGLQRVVNAAAPRLDRRLRAFRVRRTLPRWLAPERELRRKIVAGGRTQAADKLGTSFYVREMRRGLDHPLLALELEESFEMGRRLGVRLAHPFLDPDLVEYLYRFPPEKLVGTGGPDRALVRSGLAARFPDLGFDSLRKSDARAFFADLARSEGARLWRRLGGPTALEDLGIVDRKGVEAEVREMLSSTNSTPGLFRLWDLINLERWLRARRA